MIDLYGCGSPNVFKVLAMLAEIELPHRLQEVDLYSEPPALQKLPVDNWNGKLPVIVDHDGVGGSQVVVESGAILLYLAEKSGRFLPADAAARCEVMQWLMFQMSSIGPMFGQALHFRYIAPPGNDYSRSRYDIEVARLYDILEQRLIRVPFLAGDAYSIADIAAFPWVARYPKTLEIDLRARPGVRAWIDRISIRPAQQRIDAACKRLFRASLEAQSRAPAHVLDRFFGRVPQHSAQQPPET